MIAQPLGVIAIGCPNTLKKQRSPKTALVSRTAVTAELYIRYRELTVSNRSRHLLQLPSDGVTSLCFGELFATQPGAGWRFSVKKL